MALSVIFINALVLAVEYLLQKTRFTKFAKVFWTSVLPLLEVSLFPDLQKKNNKLSLYLQYLH